MIIEMTKMPNTKKNKHTRKVRAQRNNSNRLISNPNTTGRGEMMIVGLPVINRKDPLPPFQLVRFHYQSTKKYTTLAGTFGGENLYRLNSLYDPDFTGVGDYPYAFPSFQALYKNYRVTAVTIEIEFTDPSVDGMVGGVLVQPTGSGTTIQGQTLDQAGCRPMVAILPVNNTGGQKSLVRQTLTIAQIDGLSKAQHEGDPNYQAVSTGNPVNTPFVRIAVACNDVANNTATMYAQVRIIFHARMFDRILL